MAGRPRQFDEDAALDAAMKVFWEKGYEAVGVRELLEAMGVCRQSLYDTFGDKRQLFLRAIERYTRDGEASLRERLQQPGSPLANLRGLLEAKAKASSDADCRGCLAMNAMIEWGDRDPEVAELLKANLRRMERLILETIRSAQSAGEIDAAAKPKPLAQFLLFICLGYSALDRLKMPAAMGRNVLETTLGVLGMPPVTA